jgi:hypothetical protein
MTRKHTAHKNANLHDTRTRHGDEADGFNGGTTAQATSKPDPVEQMKAQAQAGAAPPDDYTPPTKEQLVAACNAAYTLSRYLGRRAAFNEYVPHIQRLERKLSRAGHRVARMRNALIISAGTGAAIAEALDD